jgi:hypothetical protein
MRIEDQQKAEILPPTKQNQSKLNKQPPTQTWTPPAFWAVESSPSSS